MQIIADGLFISVKELACAKSDYFEHGSIAYNSRSKDSARYGQVLPIVVLQEAGQEPVMWT